jgi:hypothetical protein
MIARMIKFGIVGLLAATLVGGSAYILLRPEIAQAVHEDGRGQRYASEPSGGNGKGTAGAKNEPDGDAGAGNGKGYSASEGSGDNAGRGSGRGAGSGNSGKSQSGSGIYPATEWLTVDGEVIALVDGELTIQTADGEMTTHLGPEWHWEAEGIALNAGDTVELTGFYDESEFEVARIENLTTGESTVLRDDSGRPMWAGRGGQGR